MNCRFYCILIVLFSIQRICRSQKTNKKCGLPSDILVLPDFAQDEIRSVWKDYKPGNKCEKELLITEDILTVLEMFDKEFDKQTTASTRRAVVGDHLQTTLQHSLNQSPAQVGPSAVGVDADYNDLGLFAHPQSSSSSPAVQQQHIPDTPPLITQRPDLTALATKTYSSALSIPRSGPRYSSVLSSTDEYTSSQPRLPYDRPARINFTKNVHDYDYNTDAVTQKSNGGSTPLRNDYEEYDTQRDSQSAIPSQPTKKPRQQSQFYEQSERLPF
uniref:Uncharacterized protein n=1 Tax=Ditylenchus dipsaci TaxID=166011 RepID=A0A915EEV7_9BILA